MKKIFGILAITTLLISCSDIEPTIYSGTEANPTFLSFTQGVYDLPVVIDDTGSVDIVLNSSTISTSDRTYNVTLDTESSDADPLNYTVPGTITVPANSYQGILTINGVDENLDTTAQNIVLNLAVPEGVSNDSNTITVRIFQVCPVDEALFTGMYLIEQTSAFVDGPTLSDGTIVEVTADGVSRSFSTETYPNFCGGSFLDFRFNLVCNEIVVPIQDTICRCSDVSDWFGPANVNEPYDLTDDTVFSVTFADDRLGDCGATAQTTYMFTKQ